MVWEGCLGWGAYVVYERIRGLQFMFISTLICGGYRLNRFRPTDLTPYYCLQFVDYTVDIVTAWETLLKSGTAVQKDVLIKKRSNAADERVGEIYEFK